MCDVTDMSSTYITILSVGIDPEVTLGLWLVHSM